MDKDTPVGPREKTSSIPPKSNVIPIRPVRRASGAQRMHRPLPVEGAKHLGKVNRIEFAPLKKYESLSGELENLLDAILAGDERKVRPRKRANPRPRAIDGADSPHTEKVSIRKEEIISKLRAVRDNFCIDFNEKRRATIVINNLDKGCPTFINPANPDFQKPGVMNAVLVILQQAKDFANTIWELEEYTRVDEKLEEYDDLVCRIMATEHALAEQERIANKEIMFRGKQEGTKFGRKELMELFRASMLGKINPDENGEEVYYTPETSEYLQEPEEVDRAIEFAKEVLAMLETGARTIYAKRREPFEVVKPNGENGA